MRNPAGQRTDGLHFLGLLQLGFQTAFFALDPQPFGNVAAHHPEPGGLPFFIADEGCRKFQGDFGFVRADDLIMRNMLGFSREKNLVEGMDQAVRALFAGAVPVVGPDQLAGRAAGHAAERAIDKGQGALEVDLEIALFHAFDDRAVFALAVLQAFIRLPAFVHGVLHVRAKDGEEAQHEDAGPAVVGVGSRKPLQEVRARCGKEVEQGFQKPVDRGQGDAGQDHGFREVFSIWELECH